MPVLSYGSPQGLFMTLKSLRRLIMDARNFLKVKNFKIKEGSYTFEDVKYLCAAEKKKIYKGFVSFLNNHFKHTNFTKSIYQHCHLHCGFIAHYNINGFYGEYFATAATLQKIAFNVEKQPSEYDGYYVGSTAYAGTDSLMAKHAFYKLYEELTSSKEGLGDFYGAFSGRRGYMGASMDGDYGDLNTAIKEAFHSYLEEWEELITKAMNDFEAFSQDEETKRLQSQKDEALAQAKALQQKAMELEAQLIEKQQTPQKQLVQSTLFDFMNEVA